jgi:TBC1 domain family protein 5
MPESDYFRDPRIQKLLLDVLFVWCKLNPDIGYRQGMHEILAPLVWVLEADSVELTAAEPNHTSVVGEVVDHRYVEHDAFTLFARIMQTAKSFYEQADKKSEDGEAPMIVRSRHILDVLLPSVDPELASHLRRIDVLPQIFLM